MSLQNTIVPSIGADKPKIFIAVPTKDSMHAHFAYALQALVQYNTVIGLDTVVEFNMGTLIGNQREKLARSALEQNATHIMWFDSDMVFPKDICEMLLNHNLPMVACNYSTRGLPLKAVAYSSLNDWSSFIARNATGLTYIDGIGMGCVLTKIEIFKSIAKPWFPITYDYNADDYLGEDMNFCKKVTDAGFPIVVDCDLSSQVYHIGAAAYLWNKPPVDIE